MRVIDMCLVAAAALCVSGAAWAQIPTEDARQVIDVRKLKLSRAGRAAINIDSFRGRYEYQIACHRRLLPLERHLRRCVDTQRMTTGEFHTRLDFVVTPGGQVTSFTTRKTQLQTCLMPHFLGLKFPAFAGKKAKYRLIVLVASPGCRLGRRVKGRSISIYPLGTPEEEKTYRRAVGWVMSPWSRAMSTCAELTDRIMGFGYRAKMETAIAPSGKAVRSTIELRGKLAKQAIGKLVRCVGPFLRGMRVPKHAGPGPFKIRHGTSTARWGRGD